MDRFDFIELFTNKLDERSPNWYVKALIDEDSNLITLGTDSKLIGRIFELKSNSLLQEIADEHEGYVLKKPDVQTDYPDYYYICPDGKKIAVDIKTTYLDADNSNKSRQKTSIYYTLGSYKSYLQDNEKNICGNYNDYKAHYVIGFVYDRLLDDDGRVMPYSKENLSDIKCPYGNVRVWVQEKYKITGLTEKSGDTTNIGSITRKNLDDFHSGNGPFSAMDKRICEDYWRNYKKDTTYRTVEAYFEWAKEKSTLELDFEEQEERYIAWRRNHQPTDEDLLMLAERVIHVKGSKNQDKFLCMVMNGEEKLVAKANEKKFQRLVQFCCDKNIQVDTEVRRPVKKGRKLERPKNE